MMRVTSKEIFHSGIAEVPAHVGRNLILITAAILLIALIDHATSDFPLQHLYYLQPAVEGRPLKLDAYALFNRLQASSGIKAKNFDFSLVGRAQALEYLDESGLAGSIASQDAEYFAATHFEVNPRQRSQAFIRLAQAIYLHS